MITLKFCKNYDWNNIKIVELNSFEEFFYFVKEHNEKGHIYDIKLIEGGNVNEKKMDRTISKTFLSEP